MKGMDPMAQYTKYEVKSGTRYHVRGYLGVDEMTNKQIEYNKRGFKSKKEAQIHYTRALHNFQNGEHSTDNRSKTYQEVYNEWIVVYADTVKESTLNKTKQIFSNRILPEVGKLIIDKISIDRLQNIVKDWHDKHATYKTTFNYMSNVFQFAYQRKYIKEKTTDFVTVPKKKEVDAPAVKTFYSRSELQQVMTALESMQTLKWLAFFRLLAFTGLRKGEALALTWNDINMNKGTLSVNKTLTLGLGNKQVIQPPKTEASNRIIALDEETIRILKDWKHEQAEKLIGFGFNALSKNQLLFNKYVSNTHLDLSAPRNAYVRVCEEHGLTPIKIHGFRHTHTSLLFEAGVPMKDVKERLGHADIQTTMNIYTHVTEDSKDKSAELFANYVNF